MDRRRFVPSTEGLEGRALLATSFFGSNSNRNNPAADVPATFKIKTQRIERLPHYMELIRSGRFLPEDTLKKLQADLLAITTELHAPGSGPLNGFNARLRKVEPSSSLSAPDAAGLNHSFSNILQAAGANSTQIGNLQDDMNALAKNDVNSPQPVFLATNDYTLVLQTILGIGRPIRQPTVAQLAAHNGKRVEANLGVATKSQPTLVGNYDAYATIQIVDAHGRVYGQSVVKKEGATESNGNALDTGKYAVTFDNPLPDGLHTFYVRAIDTTGHISHNSPAFKIKVITLPRDRVAAEVLHVPRGPLGLHSHHHH
jgi:hypothetical protein